VREEERRDEQQLQQNVDEALRAIVRDEEEVQERIRMQRQEPELFGLMDIGDGHLRDPSPVTQSKLDAHEDEAAAAEPEDKTSQLEIDQDDGDERALPSQQNLSKKERKAQKKLEKKATRK